MIGRRAYFGIPVAISILAAIAVLFVSCEKRERDARVLRMNIETEPPSLDWSIATDNWSIHVINNIMNGLTRYDDDLVAQPALAERWDVSDDGMVYRFHLRKDVEWTDGVPLTARHFVDGWRRLLDPATAAEYAYFLYDVEGARNFNTGELKDFSKVGVKAIDDHTLEVRLNKPIVYFTDVVNFVSTFPIRIDVIDKYGDEWTEPGNIQTLGPYKLESWRHEYRMEIVRNRTYYGPAPSIERVEMYMVGEENTGLDLYDTGKLDLIRVPSHAVPYYRSKPGYREGPAYWMFYLGFNVSKPPFDNPDVRRAFAHSIDREQVVEVIKGGRRAWAGWIPPRMFASNSDAGCPFDVKKAKTFLERAGYKSASELPETTLGFNTNLVNTMVASNVQQQWRSNIGAKIKLDNMEWKVYLGRLKEEPPRIFRLGWIADYSDPDNFMRLFISDSGNNHTKWGNPRYDRLIELAAVERDSEKRRKLYDRAQEILLVEDCVILPLFVSQVTRLVSPRIDGYKVNAMDFIFLDRLSLNVVGGTDR